MATFFHITPYNRVAPILKEGLRPPVFLTDKKDLETWLDSSLINFYEVGGIDRLVVLKVNIPKNWITYTDTDRVSAAPDVKEYVVNRPIPPSRIKPGKVILVSSVTKDTTKLTSEGKEIPVKGPGKKRTMFARRAPNTKGRNTLIKD